MSPEKEPRKIIPIPSGLMQKVVQLDHLLTVLPEHREKVRTWAAHYFQEAYKDTEGNTKYMNVGEDMVHGETLAALTLIRDISTSSQLRDDGKWVTIENPGGVEVVRNLLEKHGLVRRKQDSNPQVD